MWEVEFWGSGSGIRARTEKGVGESGAWPSGDLYDRTDTHIASASSRSAFVGLIDIVLGYFPSRAAQTY